MRGVGFEPTNPYGTGALISSDVKSAGGAEKPALSSGALLDIVTRRDYVTAPSYIGDSKLWDGFIRYVLNRYSRDHARSLIRYAHRYGHLLFSGDLRPVLELSRDKRRHVLAALSALSKYLGRYEEFKELKKRYDIKSEKTGKKIRIVARMLDSDLRSLSEWIVKAREALREYGIYIDFLMATGMRPREAITSYNLIIKLHREGRLGDYYNEPFLEHYRFEETFLRGVKNVYVSYAPREIIDRVAESKPITIYRINDRLEAAKLPIKLKEIRKLWASYMTRFLSKPEIDLIQGRVGKDVFMQNYFNPHYVSGLKERLEKGVKSLFMTVANLGVTPVTSEKKK